MAAVEIPLSLVVSKPRAVEESVGTLDDRMDVVDGSVSMTEELEMTVLEGCPDAVESLLPVITELLGWIDEGPLASEESSGFETSVLVARVDDSALAVIASAVVETLLLTVGDGVAISNDCALLAAEDPGDVVDDPIPEVLESCVVETSVPAVAEPVAGADSAIVLLAAAVVEDTAVTGASPEVLTEGSVFVTEPGDGIVELLTNANQLLVAEPVVVLDILVIAEASPAED